MTATNHTLTGALIGLALPVPALAIPLAVMSHFVLDALPHLGYDNHTDRNFITLLVLEALFVLSIFVGLAVAQPPHWQLAIVCGFAAASPDFMWLPHWVREMANKEKLPYNALERFHSRIQTREKFKNWPAEPIWAVGMLIALAKFI